MKTLLLVLAIMVFATAHSQTRPVNKKTFKVSVVDTTLLEHKGYLLSVSDSDLVMLTAPVIFDQGLFSSKGTSYSFETISKVTYSRKGAVGRGILIGGLTGAVVGTIVGAITYKKPEPCDPQNPFCIQLDFGAGLDAAAGGILGTLGGGLIGGVLGAVAKRTFIIGGRREDFKKFQINVLDKAYGNSK